MKAKTKKNGTTNGNGRGSATFRSRPKESERVTRKPAGTWDRIKLIVFCLAAFFFLAWGTVPGATYAELLHQAVRSYWWLLALAGLELARQAHYLLEENVPGYYAFWNKFFGRKDQATGRMDPWTRYRLARIAKVAFLLFLVGVFLNAMYVYGPDRHHIGPFAAVLRAPIMLFQALPSILQFAFIISLGVLQFVAIFWFMSKGGVQTYMPDDVETRFTDVKGQDAVLERVKENIIFLEDPEAIEQRGGYVPGGMLLWGPPGTGKTLIAQAVAGETARPFVFVEPGAFNAMFFGVGILKVKGLYRKLRKLSSRYGGVIVFFDEADSLGNRGMMSNPGGWGFGSTSPWTTDPACNGLAYLSDAGRRSVFFPADSVQTIAGPQREQIIMPGMGMAGIGTLQSLLAEMSGLKKPRGFFNRVIRRLLGMKPKPPPKYRILHIFATNLPQALDEAMLRPGRIDRIYKVGYPHVEGRKATFEYYFAKVHHELTDEQMMKLSTITPYATGASIQDMVNEALVIAIRDGRETITWRDVIRAKQLKEHGLPDDHEYIRRERHSVAVHEACHAVVAYRLRKHMTIDLATIERRGDVGGFVSSIPPEDQFVQWRSERDVDVMTFLASLAGERLFFEGDNTTGVGGDMRGATALTTGMLAHAAMGDTIAARSINLAVLQGAQPMETGADRELFDTEFGKMVEAKLQTLYQRTWEILEQNKMEVLSVAHALETHKTITGDDVAAIIDGTEGPLVDGRPYHDARFLDELVAYHEAAVNALHAHGDVTDAMPIPVPPSPVTLAAITSGNGQAASERPKLGQS